jgi:hypothetical protein
LDCAIKRRYGEIKMDEKKLMVAGGIVGAVALVAFAAYEFTKQPASSATTTTTTTTTGGGAKTYTALPSAAGQTVNMHVGDTLAIQIPGAPQSGYVYLFTNGTMPGWSQGATGVTSAANGGVSLTTTPLTATATGETTFTLALYPSTDGVNATAGSSAVANSQVSVTANVT